MADKPGLLMNIIKHPIAVTLIFSFFLVLQFFTAMWEAYVALTLWLWHVGPAPWGVTLWQLTFANMAVSIMIRQRKNVTQEELDKPVGQGMKELFVFSFYIPLTCLFVGWVALWFR